jgi:hypothetical protein
VAQALDGRRLILKPHPLAPGNPILMALQQRLGASTTCANVYALLTAAKQVRFLTISSSAAIEARHFGHDTHMLHAAPHANASPIASLWAHRTAAFWRAALGPMLPLRADAAFEEGLMHDRLRRKLGAWGFVQAPPPPEPAAADGVDGGG